MPLGYLKRRCFFEIPEAYATHFSEDLPRREMQLPANKYLNIDSSSKNENPQSGANENDGMSLVFTVLQIGSLLTS